MNSQTYNPTNSFVFYYINIMFYRPMQSDQRTISLTFTLTHNLVYISVICIGYDTEDIIIFDVYV